MAPSRPDMVFPGCPVCGVDVERTDLVDGVQAVPTGGETSGPPWKPINPDTLFGFRADAVPPYWTVLDGYGSPDHDVLTLQPCGHQLEGRAAHLFNLAALNLTHPDVAIEVRVVVPSALNFPDRREPRTITKTGTWSVASFGPDDSAEATLAARIRGTADAVVAMLGLEPPPPTANPVHHLRAWGTGLPIAAVRADQPDAIRTDQAVDVPGRAPAHLRTVDL